MLPLENERDQWYTNKQLFEKFEELWEQIKELQLEMRETRTLIRDYNGLRKEVAEVKAAQEREQGKESGNKNTWGYVFGGGGIGVAALTLLYNILKG